MDVMEEFVDVLIAELKKRDERIEKLERRIIGLETTNTNLERKLYKRYESYEGEVQDYDHRKCNYHE